MRVMINRKVGAALASVLLATPAVAGLVISGEGTATADPRKADDSRKITAKGGVEVRRGEARPTEKVDEFGRVPLTKTKGPTAAVEGFADALAWSLTSDVAAEDPTLVPDALGGQLNTADAAMLAGFDRTGGVEVDLESGVYRVLGYTGDAANPTQVMVEVVVPLEVDGVTQRLIAGGVVKRTDRGWVATSLRPREMKRTPDLVDQDDVVAEVETGELGLGWETFAEAAQ